MKESKTYWISSSSEFSNIYKKNGSLFRNIVKSFLDSRTDILLKLLKVKKDDIILDLGCGSGIHMQLLSPKCKKIVGLDISKEMTTKARSLLKKQKINNWELITRPADNTKLPANSFDKIIALGLLDYVSSPNKILKECARIIKNNGEILFTLPKKPSLFFFLRTKTGNKIKKLIFNLPPVDNILNKKQLIELTKKSGFRILKICSVWTTMWVIKAKYYDKK